ncbi:hypothetical protein QCA50_016455 [Cerrena zonata]|uniref:Uncharacterized protein n=1 Tax=Cerrena zonata TaxID=2478898 RepID=A0AAW0FT31_9APHY
MSMEISLNVNDIAQISNAVKQHPCAPEGLVPGKGEVIKSTPYFNSNSIEPKDGEVFSRSQLSPRFRYSFPKEDEAENIISGGASIVF